jgi:hypothetical protein
VCVDCISGRVSLPLGCIGSQKPGQSFEGSLSRALVITASHLFSVQGYWRTHGFGRMRELRQRYSGICIWMSQVLFRKYRVRSMTLYTGFRGLLAYLKCDEGFGTHTLDCAHTLASCALHACEWEDSSDAPLIRAFDVPRHLLRDEEGTGGNLRHLHNILHIASGAGMGIYESSDMTRDGDSVPLIELTGYLTRAACRCLCDATKSARTHDFCEQRGARRAVPSREGDSHDMLSAKT